MTADAQGPARTSFLARLLGSMGFNRLALGTTLLACVAMTAAWAWVVATERQLARELSERHAKALSSQLTGVLLDVMVADTKEELNRHMARLEREHGIRVRVRNAAGQVRFSWDPSEVEAPGDSTAPVEPSRGPPGMVPPSGTSEDPEPGMAVSVRELVAQGPCLKCHELPGKLLGRMDIEVPVAWLESGVIRTANRFALAGAGLMVFIVGAALLGSRKLNQRIDRLARSMDRAAEGDLEYRAPRYPEDGIGRLGATFNGLLVRLRDARRETEEAHRCETLHLEQLAATGELAAGTAHEVKNALGAMGVTLDALARKETDLDKRARIIHVREKLDEVNSAVVELLEFAKPRNPVFESVDPVACLERVLGVLEGRIRKTGAVVRQRTDGKVPSIEADHHLLGQVLINVLVNAMEARPRGLELDLELRMIDAGAGGEDRVEIRVQDNGPGIDPETLRHIFRPFHTTKRPGGGTGLGLAVSRDIVRRHGGEIHVESTPGCGTCFTVVLPVRHSDRPGGAVP